MVHFHGGDGCWLTINQWWLSRWIIVLVRFCWAVPWKQAKIPCFVQFYLGGSTSVSIYLGCFHGKHRQKCIIDLFVVTFAAGRGFVLLGISMVSISNYFYSTNSKAINRAEEMILMYRSSLIGKGCFSLFVGDFDGFGLFCWAVSMVDRAKQCQKGETFSLFLISFGRGFYNIVLF